MLGFVPFVSKGVQVCSCVMCKIFQIVIFNFTRNPLIVKYESVSQLKSQHIDEIYIGYKEEVSIFRRILSCCHRLLPYPWGV